VVQFLDADPAGVAVAGPRGSVDVAGEAKFDPIDPHSLGDDIADLNVTADVLVFGDVEVVLVCLVFFRLTRPRCTIF